MSKDISRLQKLAGLIKEGQSIFNEPSPDDLAPEDYDDPNTGLDAFGNDENDVDDVNEGRYDSDVDELIRTLSSLISTNSNLSTADKEVMLPMLSQIQSVVDNMVDDDEDLDDSYDEPVSDYSKRRMRDRY